MDWDLFSNRNNDDVMKEAADILARLKCSTDPSAAESLRRWLATYLSFYAPELFVVVEHSIVCDDDVN
uniref:Uncharacterized protein n=1 Tax=Romanomermis culicivorax TaxID=13658 RepID=A0A915HTF8_ROMCU